MRAEEAKPQEVLDLYSMAGELFETLRLAFDVPRSYKLSLDDVDGPAEDVAPSDSAAFAMRQLQVIRRYARPDCAVPTEYFVAVTVDLVRALDELAEIVTDQRQRSSMLAARDLLYAASWAVVRDTGGPGAGLSALR